MARSLFPRLSFDLITARPGQTVRGWQAELRRALALAADHLSLYQLTIEPGTVFEGLHRQGKLVLPEAETAAALYDATGEEAENSACWPTRCPTYASRGAESRHNLQYWRYGDYAGIGPGAHGRLSIGGALVATRRHRAPEPWAERVEAQGHGSTEETALGPLERAREALIMGLRLSEGIAARPFRRPTRSRPRRRPSTRKLWPAPWRRATSSATTPEFAPHQKGASGWTPCWRRWCAKQDSLDRDTRASPLLYGLWAPPPR